jgi:nucleoid DNA-binding protein
LPHDSGERVNTVTKADLVRVVSISFGYSKSEARQFVDTFFEALTEAIIQGDRIEARGFGAFTVKGANAKAGARNPKTGERVFVPARRKVAFKPGRILREALSRPADASGVEAAPVEAATPARTRPGNGSSHGAPMAPPIPVRAPGTQLPG